MTDLGVVGTRVFGNLTETCNHCGLRDKTLMRWWYWSDEAVDFVCAYSCRLSRACRYLDLVDMVNEYCEDDANDGE